MQLYKGKCAAARGEYKIYLHDSNYASSNQLLPLTIVLKTGMLHTEIAMGRLYRSLVTNDLSRLWEIMPTDQKEHGSRQKQIVYASFCDTDLGLTIG